MLSLDEVRTLRSPAPGFHIQIVTSDMLINV